MRRLELAWMDDAVCAAPAHRSLPWLSDTDTLTAATLSRMRGVCVSCPVAPACAGYVESAKVTGGFWAGVDRGRTRLPKQLVLDLGTLGGVA